MKRDTIVYKNQNYHRYPDSNLRNHRAYYFRHDKMNESPISLHRQIWIDNKGAIPKGMIVHHKDENTLNNKISNLELMTRADHMRLHASSPKRISSAKRTIKIAAEYAKLWHKSKVGREWHKKQWKATIGKYLKAKKSL